MTSFFLSWLKVLVSTGATDGLFSAGNFVNLLAPIIRGSTVTVVSSSKAAAITIIHRCRVFISYPPNSLTTGLSARKQESECRRSFHGSSPPSINLEVSRKPCWGGESLVGGAEYSTDLSREANFVSMPAFEPTPNH